MSAKTGEPAHRARKLRALALLTTTGLFTLLLLSACGDNTATTASTTGAASGTSTASTVAAPSATTAAAQAGDSSNLIRIYSSLPIVGGYKDSVQNSINAFKLALDDFTGGTGKVGNFNIEYISLSDGNEATGEYDTEIEKANATKVANDPAAMLYLGPSNSGAAKASIPVLNQAGVAMISPDNSYPGLTRSAAGVTRVGEPEMYYPVKTRNYFRLSIPDDLQGPAIVDFYKSLNAKKVFVIDDSQVYGKGLADSVVASCKKEGLDCSKRSSITKQESSYAALVAGIKANNPDAILYAGAWQPSVQKLLSDIRSAGLTVPIVGGDGLNVETVAKDSTSPNPNIYTTNAGLPEEKLPVKGQEALKRYQAKYGKYEYPRVALAYESMYAGLTALKNAGVKDRKAIIQAVANLKDFDGILGKWSFDPNGDINLTDFSVLQVSEGKWKFFTLVRPRFEA